MISPNIQKSFLFLLLFLVAGQGFAQDTDSTDKLTTDDILEWKETFKYEVRYSFFKLGEVTVEFVEDTSGHEADWQMQTIITSNSSVPFVGKEENHYNSLFPTSDSLPRELLYWRDNVDEDKYEDIRYEFDYENGKVYAEEEDVEPDTLDLEGNGGSGQLIFLLSRVMAGQDTSYTMPLYLNMERGDLKINSTPQTEMRQYDAFDEEVETLYSEGETTIEGPFGFKGTYKAWFRNDELRVPVEAHVRVWLGNAKIKLIEYSKEPRE